MGKITIGSKDLNIELKLDFLDNACAKDILKGLPIESKAQIWGDEIYFDTGIKASATGATLDVNVGDIAYWPEGKCLCIFFGATPISSNDKPVPASEVVVVAQAKVDPVLLRKVKPGSLIKVE